jgi:multiple sugar transport system substrate-binding protein
MVRLLKYLMMVVCAAVSVYVLSVGPIDETPGANEVLISVWYPWAGEAGERLREAIVAFNETGMTEPGTGKRIRVIPLYARNDISTNQKLFIAIAGGSPPDVTFVDGPQVAEWAHRGALVDLTAMIRSAGIKPEDYYPPCWRQNIYRGLIYALTFCADPNFGLFWNKDAFRRAGLDPGVAPRTIAELDAMADRLTERSGDFYEAIGLIPWGVYGSANSMYTWGWVFGGRFYDEQTDTITCEDPRIVTALEWIKSYDRRYDKQRIAALQSGFGSGERNPFVLGKLAMHPTVITGLREIRRYAPGLEFGIAPMPYPDDERWGRGEPRSSWVGGWCLAIPTGSRHPKAAFEFVRWLCATDEGTEWVVRATGSFPGMRTCRYIRWLASDEGAARDPARHRLLQILEACRHQRPVIPVQAYYMDQLRRALDECLYKDVPAARALATARANTQAALDRARAEARRRAMQ